VKNKGKTRVKKEDTALSTLELVFNRVRNEEIMGRIPLFVLGAGISSNVVPFLSQIGAWLYEKVTQLDPPADRWIVDHISAIKNDKATRRQAAELFSLVQAEKTLSEQNYSDIWKEFSKNFMLEGLEINANGERIRFPGIRTEEVHPTTAHKSIAEFVRAKHAYVLSLNFDGLTHKALIEDGNPGIVLHTAHQVESYFCADTRNYVPAVIKVRGDVFFARCEIASCPLSIEEYPIDRINVSGTAPKRLLCPVCAQDTLRLQFSFPGYREKEEFAEPMLWETRRFIASRLSSVFVIGLSGRWDRYLLQYIFSLVQERNLLLVDIKPQKIHNHLENFRSSFYPSVEWLNTKNWATGARYAFLEMDANSFMTRFRDGVGD